jgi:hypothetical protein
VIVTAADEATPKVEMAKVALEAPAGTVTLAGTVAALALELESVTAAPPAGAMPVSVAVPNEETPATTVPGLAVIVESAAGITVSVALCDTFRRVAPIDEVAVVPTPRAATVKVAVVAPVATVTVAGTVAALVLLLDRLRTVPPTGAAPFNVTVPVEVPPAATLAGESITLEGRPGSTVRAPVATTPP